MICRRSSQAGFGLPIAMVLVVMTGAVAVVVGTRDETVRRDVRTDEHALRATFALDGALAHARHALAGDAAYIGEVLTIGRTKVDLRVQRAAPKGWSILAKPISGGTPLRATVLPNPDGLPTLATWSRR